MNDNTSIVYRKTEETLFFIINIFFALLMFLISKNVFVLILPPLLSIFTNSLVPNDKKLIKWINISIVLFYCIMLLTYFGWSLAEGIPYMAGGTDDLKFEQYGESYYANGWFNFTQNYGYSTNTRLYVFFISILYKISNMFGGYHTLIPRIFNGFFEVWIIIILYKLMIKRWGINRYYVITSLMVLILNPYFKFINSHVFRDAMSLLFFFIIIYLFHLFQNQTKNFIYIFAIIVFMFLSYYLRSQLLLIEFISIIIMYIFNSKYNIKKLVVLASVFILLILLDYYTNSFGFFSTNEIYVEYQSESGGFTSKMVSLPLVPFGIIARFTYAFTIPWPNLFVLFDNDYYCIIHLIYSLCYIYVFWQVANIIPIIRGMFVNLEVGVLFIFTLSLYALATLTFRHAVFFYPFLAICYSLGKKSNRLNQRNNFLIKIFILLVFMLIIMYYGLIKY